MKRNNGINILKAIACMGVVFIHIKFPGLFGEIVYYVSMVAVPCFFMIAGYYSYGCNEETIKRRLIKMLKILAFAVVIWFIYRLTMPVINHSAGEWFAENFNWKTPFKVIIACTIRWAIPLWYLIAMAETYFAWLLLVRRGLQERMTRYTWILFAAGAFLTVVVESCEFDWLYKYNFLVKAMPWFLLGYMIKEKYEQQMKDISDLKLLLIAVAGWIFTISFALAQPVINLQRVGIILSAPAVFMIAVRRPGAAISRPVEYIAEKLSLFIYILHVPASSVIFVTARHFGVDVNGLPFLWAFPLLTLTAAILVSAAFERIFRNPKLKRLIS